MNIFEIEIDGKPYVNDIKIRKILGNCNSRYIAKCCADGMPRYVDMKGRKWYNVDDVHAWHRGEYKKPAPSANGTGKAD